MKIRIFSFWSKNAVSYIQLHVIMHDTNHTPDFPKLKFENYSIVHQNYVVAVNKPIIYLSKKKLPFKNKGQKKHLRIWPEGWSLCIKR